MLWDKTGCHGFEANRARIKMGVKACNILRIILEYYVRGEPVKHSTAWLILRLIEVGAEKNHHAGRWHVYVASAFPLFCHGRTVFDGE